MSGVLRAEDFERSFTLRQRADKIRLRCCKIRVRFSGSDLGALAEPGVHDHPVQATQLVAQLTENPDDGIVFGHIEFAHCDADRRVLRHQLPTQRVETIRPPGTQREVATGRGESPGHLLPQTRTGTGDQNLLPRHGCNCSHHRALVPGSNRANSDRSGIPWSNDRRIRCHRDRRWDPPARTPPHTPSPEVIAPPQSWNTNWSAVNARIGPVCPARHYCARGRSSRRPTPCPGSRPDRWTSMPF